jgi:hypothetical protein
MVIVDMSIIQWPILVACVGGSQLVLVVCLAEN